MTAKKNTTTAIDKLKAELEKANKRISDLKNTVDSFSNEIDKLTDDNIDKNVIIVELKLTSKDKDRTIKNLENELEQLRYEHQRELLVRKENQHAEVSSVLSQRDQLAGYIQGAMCGSHQPIEYDINGCKKQTAIDEFVDRNTSDFSSLRRG